MDMSVTLAPADTTAITIRLESHPGYNRVFQPGELTVGLILPLETHPGMPHPTMRDHISMAQRAESLGVDTTRVKVFVFTVSSAFAGLAGAFYGHYLVVLSPQMADFNEMAKLIIMVVLGGLGTVLGPLIGAAPVQILTTYLQKYGEWDLVIFAIVVIALMRTHVGGIDAFVYAGLARLSLYRRALATTPDAR